jgi:ribosomal protein S14
MKHRWITLNRVSARCERCGMTRTLRPHPYARRWFREFVPAGGGPTVSTLYGARTPPCVPDGRIERGAGPAGPDA